MVSKGHKRLRAALLVKLDCSRQALHKRVRLITARCPMSQLQAHGIVAFKEKMQLDKFLDQGELDSVRDALKDLDARSGAASSDRPHSGISRPREAKPPKIAVIATYETNDPHLRAHIDEINRTYTFRCYTATFVLCRKVIENLVIHHIVRKRYPAKSTKGESIFYDVSHKRYHTFSTILNNIESRADDFAPDQKLVRKMCRDARKFKDDANDMAHELFFVAGRPDVDNAGIQGVLDLIARLERNVNAAAP